MKGVEAPFQLVVSVVAMLMVLVLAYSVLSNAQREDCNRKWEIELSKLSSVLSTVIHGSAPTKVSTTFDFRCGDAVRYDISLKMEDNPNVCLRICGTSEGRGCAFFQLTTYDRKNDVVAVVRSCIEGASSYIPTGSGSCPRDFENVTDDLFRGIELSRPFGRILIKREFGSVEPIVICMG